MNPKLLIAASLLVAVPAFAAESAPVEGTVLAVRPIKLSGQTYTNVRVKLDRCNGEFCGGRVNVLFADEVRLVRGARLELRLPEETVKNLHAYKIRRGKLTLALRADSAPRAMATRTNLAQALR